MPKAGVQPGSLSWSRLRYKEGPSTALQNQPLPDFEVQEGPERLETYTQPQPYSFPVALTSHPQVRLRSLQAPVE